MPDTFFINGTMKPAIFTEILKILHPVTLMPISWLLLRVVGPFNPFFEMIFIVEPHRQEIHTVLLEEFSGISLII